MRVQVQYLDKTIVIDNPQLKFQNGMVSVSDGQNIYVVKQENVTDYEGSGISVPNRGRCVGCR